MTINVIIPKMGMHESEGTIVEWLKKDGETVQIGDVLLHVENDKVVNEIVAEAQGTLKVLVTEGETHPVGTIVGAILTSVEQTEAVPVPAQTIVQIGSNGQPHLKNRSIRTKLRRYSTPPTQTGLRASPLARRIAAELGINLRQITGSGPHGRIVQQDVLMFQAPAVNPSIVEPGEATAGTSRPLTIRQRRMATKMVDSLQATAQFTLTMRVDVTELAQTRQMLSDRWSKRISYTDLIVYAVALSLQRHPQIMATWQEDHLTIPNDLHIGLAVATDQGLIVPVVRQVDRLSLRETHDEITILVEKTRTNQLLAEDVGGGCFTVSNLGMFGIDWFTPILNAPESAILGVGQIEEILVRRDGQIVDAQRMPLSLTLDHRLIDGALGASFLQSVRGYLEDPLSLFID